MPRIIMSLGHHDHLPWIALLFYPLVGWDAGPAVVGAMGSAPGLPT